MANIYVRSTDGNNADNGSTWALAKATVAGAMAIATSGDTIWVSQVHAESAASAISWNMTSGVANPIKIVCANDGAAPPTALATTGTVTTTGANGITIGNGVGGLYIYGLTFNCGTGSTRADLIVGLSTGSSLELTAESCNFNLVNTGASAGIYLPHATADNAARGTYLNCTFKFAATSQVMRFNASARIVGGSMGSGTSTPTGGFIITSAVTSFATGGRILFEDFDFSNLGSSVDLVAAPSFARQPITIRNCKLPASWSGNLSTGTFSAGVRVEMFNCDAASTNYRLWIEDGGGSIKQETTLIRSGGASDGTTPLSWKMVSVTNPGYLGLTFRSPEIVVWNTSTASKTVSVEILRDSATNLTDKEIWLEVSYPNSSTTPLYALITDMANIVTAAADQTASSVTWVTTGMSNPNKQQLSVTFTPQRAGPFYCAVCIAKISATIYVDPKVNVT